MRLALARTLFSRLVITFLDLFCGYLNLHMEINYNEQNSYDIHITR